MTLKRSITAAALVMLALQGLTPARAADPERVTLYFHSNNVSGTIDEVGSVAGATSPPTMDPQEPTGQTPKFSALVLSAAANDEVPGNILLPFWTGRVSGVASNITVTFWAQGRGSQIEVSLFVDGGAKRLARSRTTPIDGPAQKVEVTFKNITTPVGGGIILQFVALGRSAGVYYDSADMPSNVSMDIGPLPDLAGTPGIVDALGRVSWAEGGGCADGDALCARAEALRDDSHVVIAVMDTGINPYHVAYRRDGMDVHPSEYVTGYPSNASAISLTTEGPTYSLSRANDDAAVWSQVEQNTLYWFPGTNIIGAVSVGDDEHGGVWEPRPIIDDAGHGTGSTSVAAGGGARSTDGVAYGSNPDALIVLVEGMSTEAMRWVSEQPWIDFVSGSYGDRLSVPVGGITGGEENRYSKPFVLRDGRTACFSSGNGVSKTGLPPDHWSSIRPTSGPSWVVTVGAASPRNEQAYWWHNIPVDAVSYGMFWPAADAFSLDGEIEFSGTSSATPISCGVFSKALLEARRALADTDEGTHDGRPAIGAPVPASPFLRDGALTRLELQDAVLKTAAQVPADPETLPDDPGVHPTAPGSVAFQGYGVLNVASAARAVAVLLGSAVLPDRSEVDAFIAAVDAVRDVVYPPN